jgi:hypothetical protein
VAHHGLRSELGRRNGPRPGRAGSSPTAAMVAATEQTLARRELNRDFIAGCIVVKVVRARPGNRQASAWAGMSRGIGDVW